MKRKSIEDDQHNSASKVTDQVMGNKNEGEDLPPLLQDRFIDDDSDDDDDDYDENDDDSDSDEDGDGDDSNDLDSSSSSSSSENEESSRSSSSNEVGNIAVEELERANERSRNEIIAYHRAYMAEISAALPNIHDEDDGDDEDDDNDDNDDNEDEDEDEDEDDDDDDDDDHHHLNPAVIPTPEEVELEYTFPNDFVGGSHWNEIVDVDTTFFQLIIDPACTAIPNGRFEGYRKLIEIVFPKAGSNSLERIGRNAFRCCFHLQRITNGLPNGLTEVDDNAFDACRSLSGVICIPKSVTLLGQWCFDGCSSITSVVFDPKAHVEIRPGAFCYCESIITVELPQQLTSIPQRCFYKCSSLINFDIPVSTVRIHEWAFEHCSSLQSVDLPESIRWVGSKAYANCTSLQSLTIRSSSTATVTGFELEDETFEYCEKLRSVKLPNNLTAIPGGCFRGCCSLIDIPIPGTVHEVRRNAFYGCSSLMSLDLPESIRWVGGEAFAYCTSLRRLTIRSSSYNVIIGTNIVNGCSVLSKIKILPSVWPKLFASMNGDPSFLHKFLREYQYQMQRLVEWKKNN